jgi:UDP-3-O-[3-hydroxymyristoyl] glucosamine N-acyltransferase
MFPVSIPVRQLAELVRGALHGDGDVVIRAARPLHQAEAGDITFLDRAQQVAKLQACRASAVVVPAGITVPGPTLIQVAEPLSAFIAIALRLHAKPPEPARGVDARAAVHASVRFGAEPSVDAFAAIGANTVIGARCRVHAGVVIGRDCRLGDDVVLHPHVVLYDAAILGDRVIIHANCVIGADGFGYRQQIGKHVKVPQLGNVEIGADVEIGACTTIDRATFGATRIGPGTKIDNLVQVAHNCVIGSHNLLCAQTGIAGSSSTGHYVVMGGQAGVADHVHVGDGAMIAAQSGAISDVAAKEKVFGMPARPAREQMRLLALVRRLPEMQQELQRLAKLLDERGAAHAA